MRWLHAYLSSRASAKLRAVTFLLIFFLFFSFAFSKQQTNNNYAITVATEKYLHDRLPTIPLSLLTCPIVVLDRTFEHTTTRVKTKMGQCKVQKEGQPTQTMPSFFSGPTEEGKEREKKNFARERGGGGLDPFRLAGCG